MENNRKLESDIIVFDEWVKNISENQEVGEIDPMLVKGVLESYGANFEISENAKASLSKYSNFAKKEGLDAVWGDKLDSFKKWAIEVYIPQVEKRVGRELHTLWDKKTETYDNVKHSGMMQFLGELTAFAAGEMPLEKYKKLTENRINKGKKWEFGDPYEPYKPSRNSGFPVDFPVKAMDIIKVVI